MKKLLIRMLLAGMAFLPAASVRADLILGQGSTVTVTNGAVLDSSGSIVVGGVMDLSGGTPGKLRLTRDWNKSDAGIFRHGSSTVTFYNVMSSSITGNSTFYVLLSTEPGKTLMFQQGSTQTLVNVFNVGNTSLGNEVRLRSTVDGEPWFLSVLNGPRRVSFVDVKNSTANPSRITACDSNDSGNNYNWFFPGALSVSFNSSSYDFGNVPMSGSSQTYTALVVTNNGCGPETFLLSASTATPDTPWKVGADAASAPGDNILLLRGLFHPTRPATPGSDFGTEDVVNITPQYSDGTKYSLDGSETGAAVPADGQRNFWWYLQMPLGTQTTAQQKITGTITAAP